MFFPLFCLPIEIRMIIYEEVFRNRHPDKTIAPVYKRGDGCINQYTDYTVNKDLGLLQTCQQAQEEGTTALYTNHIYYFDDEWNDLEGNLMYDQLHRTLSVGQEQGLTYYEDYPKGGIDYLSFPCWDFFTMYEWLVAIGEKNRMKLRHVHLHFIRPTSSMMITAAPLMKSCS